MTGDAQPNPSKWVEINVTNLISGSSVNGHLTVSGLTGTTFQITPDLYNNSGVTYNLANYINIPKNGETDLLNFGDEYYSMVI